MLASDKVIKNTDIEQNDIFTVVLNLINGFYHDLTHAETNTDLLNLTIQSNLISDEFKKLTELFKQAKANNKKVITQSPNKLSNVVFNMSLIIGLYDDKNDKGTARIFFYNYINIICEAARKFCNEFRNYLKVFTNNVQEESLIQILEFSLTKGLANVQLYLKNYQLAETYYLDYVEVNQSRFSGKETTFEKNTFNTNMANSHLFIAEICVINNQIEKADTNIERCLNLLALTRLESQMPEYKSLQSIIEEKIFIKIDILAKITYKARNLITTKNFYQKTINFIKNIQQENKILLKDEILNKYRLGAENYLKIINKYIFEKIINKYFNEWSKKYSDYVNKLDFISSDYSVLLSFKQEKIFDLFLEEISNGFPDITLKPDKAKCHVVFKNITSLNYNNLFRIVNSFSEKYLTNDFLKNIEGTEDNVSTNKAQLKIIPTPATPITENSYSFYCHSSQQLPVKKIKKQPIVKSIPDIQQKTSLQSELLLTWPNTNITFDANKSNNVTPLSSTYIPNGSYFGYIDSRILEKLPPDKQALSTSFENVLRRGKLVGKTGQGVKFIKKELRKEYPEYIYKIKPLGIEGDYRLLGRVAETIIVTDNRHRHLIIFDLLVLNTHKESRQYIELDRRLGSHGNVSSSPSLLNQ